MNSDLKRQAESVLSKANRATQVLLLLPRGAALFGSWQMRSVEHILWVQEMWM